MTTAAPIRVMLVDDHSIVRKGLMTILKNRADLKVVGEARTGQEALQQCEQTQPEVILMDLIMPELDGVAATRLIHKRWPQIQIIALTSFQEKQLVQDALQAGAISYLLKNISGEDLIEAICAAFGGRPTLAPEAVQSLIQPEGQDAALGRELTRREREVLAFLTKGLNNAEIADRMSVSPSTVKVHVSSILSKLRVSNRSEAISVAIQHKLVGGV